MSLADYACADEPAHVFAYHADALAFLRSLPDDWTHAIITDPPYGLADHKPEVVAQAITAWASGDRERVPTGRGFMGREWDSFVPPPAVWDECLRVLKPGGHLAVFAGSRTVDLMGLSIRLAGFEMRDGIAAWLYGSGFPKSLDVSKAIDKAAGAPREVVGSKLGQPGYSLTNGNGDHRTYGRGLGNTGSGEDECAITAPATDAAREWQGYGTALKPAHEPILLARKPLAAPATNVLGMVESELRNRGVDGEVRWTRRPARPAGKRNPSVGSTSTSPQPTAGTSAVTASASATAAGDPRTPSTSGNSTWPGGSATGNTPAPTGVERTLNCETPSSTPTAEPALAATNGNASSSPSITSTAAEPHTGSQSTERFTLSSDEKGTLPVTESFAGIATGLTGSRATVRIDRLADGTFVWPDGLPGSVPGGPATVAANVLAHRTGAINIDACRVQGGGPTTGGGGWAAHKVESTEGWDRPYTNGVAKTEGHDSGRWPSNVVLAHHPDCRDTGETRAVKTGTAVNRNRDGRAPSTVGYASSNVDPADITYGTNGTEQVPVFECAPGCQVAALDEQSGIMRARGNVTPTKRPAVYGASAYMVGSGESGTPDGGDQGGASRFFPTFRYGPGDLHCHPDCQVAALDEQSGITPSNSRAHKGRGMGYHGGDREIGAWTGGDTGGASRFFPTFRYQAKAPKAERPIVDGTGHPTVKPLGLMRWLVRLLVPGEVDYPDGSGTCGAVLDPFAGSGATLEAARLEGRRAVGVERDEHSVRLIAERLGVECRPLRTDEPDAVPEADPFDLLLSIVFAAPSLEVLADLRADPTWSAVWGPEHEALAALRANELTGVAA